MISWLTELLDKSAHPVQYVAVAALVFLVTLAVSSAVVAAVIVNLPADYLSTSRARKGHTRRGPTFSVGAVLRNIFGVLLIALGLVLSLPGLPGQGLLTVLAGLFLLDFPGKRSLLRKLVSMPSLLKSINRLRARFSRPPLVVDRVAATRKS